MAGRVSEERYRRRWTWDKVVKVTHTRANCISACSFDAYVRDGVVVWEEPNCSYAQTCPDVPDFNPRGCPMGCVYSRTMYGPFRVKSPLKRVGPRGSGQFQPISWDQALTEIADKIIDVILEDGPECIVYDHGTTNVDFGIGSMMESHLFTVGLGATSVDSWAGVGDLPTGLIQTWGTFLPEGTADDWFYADFIVIWVGNPNYARVPDAHFIYEARYKGATVVTIAPDYSPSAIHADYYVPVRFATDAALALSLCHVIVEEGLYNEDFIKEQTDLPLLVRTDTRRFLRQCDLQEGGKEDIFYMWDIHRQAPVEAPGSWGHPVYSLKLGDISPALAGQYEVTLKDGTKAKVRPLFSLFQEHLKAYAPERAAAITGVGPQAIRELAREMAKARSLMVYMSWGRLQALPLRPLPQKGVLPPGPHRQYGGQARRRHEGLHLVAGARHRPHPRRGRRAHGGPSGRAAHRRDPRRHARPRAGPMVVPHGGKPQQPHHPPYSLPICA
jgi:anaerobic selenocysteine-containing dehydrogenase